MEKAVELHESATTQALLPLDRKVKGGKVAVEIEADEDEHDERFFKHKVCFQLCFLTVLSSM
jgi:hypothetical protein